MPVEPRRFERLYGVLGHPLAHTLSPALHNWGFARCGLPGVYLPFPQPAENLERFMSAVRALPLHGVSVTLPHKTTVIPYLDGLSERAERIGAVNTLYWEDGRLLGENTDIHGILTLPAGTRVDNALILGGGGSCLAVIAGLRELGARRIVMAVRDPRKVRALVPDADKGVDVEPRPWEERLACMDDAPDVVVNTTPIGMAGHSEEESPLPAGAWERVSPSCAAVDVIYNPLETRFLREAARAGRPTRDGLDFFLAQGLAQFSLWTGLDLPFGAARVFLEQVLHERAKERAAGRR